MSYQRSTLSGRSVRVDPFKYSLSQKKAAPITKLVYDSKGAEFGARHAFLPSCTSYNLPKPPGPFRYVVLGFITCAALLYIPRLDM